MRGRVAALGLQGPLRIRRDGWGIPHLDAENIFDAWFGLGFCQGQDRAFQLEILLRVIRGTLAELIGAAALSLDRLSRRIGFHRAAREQLPRLDPVVRQQLQAFAAGVSAGASVGLPRRPHEFVLLRSTPTPWTAADSLGLLKLQSFGLAANWDVELARLRILLEDGPDAVLALNPECSPPDLTAVRSAFPGLDHLRTDLAALASFTSGGGSNNWVLGGSRTQSGRPLLANDPHLNCNFPPHWYLAHLRTPEWTVAGASFVGLPIFPVGHNGFAAWGLTAGLLDNTDFFLEQLAPDGRSARRGDHFEPCDIVEEVIHVKGAAPVVEWIPRTRHGPIISPALLGEWPALALRATWLDPLPARGLFLTPAVRSFAEFRSLFRDWPFGSVNMVYAEAGGTIGWQLGGRAPRRRGGSGLLPQPGWDENFGWEESGVPFDDMPWIENPPEGFLATGNAAPSGVREGLFLGADWMDPYRLQVVVEELTARRDWDRDGCRRLQIDQRSLPWRELREVVLGLPTSAVTALGLQLLRDWDGILDDDSAAASVFLLFLNEMILRTARAKAPKSHRTALGEGATTIAAGNFFCYRRTGHVVRLLREQPAGWFERSWRGEMSDALAASLTLLRRRCGPDVARWGWGRLRTLTMLHPLGRSKTWLAPFFNLGPTSCGGDSNTVAQASVLPLDPLMSCPNLASLRVVIDVGAWSESRFALPGGQSGNPTSRHYSDQFPHWQTGEGVPIAWSETEIEAATRDVLEVTPE
jgi:penicillin amidase